ncbi:MAG TPA: DUF2800 domain-containing protein, partial [Phycisphaerales bacterium]|nr:DUF2800 domain-containing protein [Phycisphaerales bacterium]
LLDGPDVSLRGEARRFEVDEGMAEHVQGYLDRTREWLKFNGAALFTEQRLSIEHVTGEPGATGTSDAVIVIPRAAACDLVVRDLKYGQGVGVNAKGNSQLLIYASAALETFALAYGFSDDSVVYMEIDQPRRSHLSTWSITVADLRAHVAKIGRAAAVALATPATGKRAAGDWCKFCPARAECEERVRFVAGSMIEGLTNLDEIPAQPDRSKLGFYLSRVQAIRDWCSAVEQEAHDALVRGEKVDGYKLVLGRQGDRKWTDPDAAGTFVISHGVPREKVYESKLRSPAQVEKLLPKEARPLLAPLITRSPGSPTVAPESDPRPAYTGPSADGLQDLTEASDLI